MEKKKPYAASQFRWKHRIIFDFFLEMAGLTGKRQILPRLIRSNGGRIFSQKLHRFPESTPPRVADDSCFAEMHLPGGR